MIVPGQHRRGAVAQGLPHHLTWSDHQPRWCAHAQDPVRDHLASGVQAQDTAGVFRLLLQFEPEAGVLASPALRNEVATKVADIMALYHLQPALDGV